MFIAPSLAKIWTVTFKVKKENHLLLPSCVICTAWLCLQATCQLHVLQNRRTYNPYLCSESFECFVKSQNQDILSERDDIVYSRLWCKAWPDPKRVRSDLIPDETFGRKRALWPFFSRYCKIIGFSFLKPSWFLKISLIWSPFRWSVLIPRSCKTTFIPSMLNTILRTLPVPSSLPASLLGLHSFFLHPEHRLP